MGERCIAPDSVICLADRKSITGTARRESFKTEVGQQSSTTHVPGIGDNERSGALVKLNKSCALLGLCQHAIPLSFLLRRKGEGPFNNLHKVSLFAENDTFALRHREVLQCF